jgi:transposase
MDSSRDVGGIVVPESDGVSILCSRKEESVEKHTTIAVDLAKCVFEIAVSHRPGRVAERHRLARARLLPFFAQRPPATVVLEACGSAHHWARELQALGHRPVLLPAQHVRPYVRRNKTDRTDTAGLLEAFRCADIQAVAVKSVAQQTLTSLHRLRSAWLATRTARLNTARGILRELGLIIPVGARHVLPRLATLLDDPDSPLPMALRPTLTDVCSEIRELQAKIRQVQRQLEALARQIPAVTRLRTAPGIGLLTATALVASVGDVHRFRSGRHFASFFGLTPREHSSGSVRRLGHISKRGDPYLRTLLIHGARSVLWTAKKLPHPDRLRAWALQTQRRCGHNKAATALANKLARIAWALWKHERNFQSSPPPQAT